MGTIAKSMSEELDLTIFRVEGLLTCGMILSHLRGYYRGDKVTRHLVWDFTQAAITHLTQGEMERILNVAQANVHLRRQGRTALVGPQDLIFGMARMYEILAEISEHPLEHRVTRDLDSALAWITKAPVYKEGQA